MTTLKALWMGVPVVTAPGATISSRLAAATLTAAKLTDFIATGGAPSSRGTTFRQSDLGDAGEL